MFNKMKNLIVVESSKQSSKDEKMRENKIDSNWNFLRFNRSLRTRRSLRLWLRKKEEERQVA